MISGGHVSGREGGGWGWGGGGGGGGGDPKMFFDFFSYFIRIWSEMRRSRKTYLELLKRPLAMRKTAFLVYYRIFE